MVVMKIHNADTNLRIIDIKTQNAVSFRGKEALSKKIVTTPETLEKISMAAASLGIVTMYLGKTENSSVLSKMQKKSEDFQKKISIQEANDILNEQEIADYCRAKVIESCLINGEINKSLFTRLVKIAKESPEIDSWMVEHLKNEKGLDKDMMLKFDELYSRAEVKDLGEIYTIFRDCFSEGTFNEDVYNSVFKLKEANNNVFDEETRELLELAFVGDKFEPDICEKISKILLLNVTPENIHQLYYELLMRKIDHIEFLRKFPAEIIAREIEAGRIKGLAFAYNFDTNFLNKIAGNIEKTKGFDDLSIDFISFSEDSQVLDNVLDYMKQGYSKELATVFGNLNTKDFDKKEIENLYQTFSEKFLKRSNAKRSDFDADFYVKLLGTQEQYNFAKFVNRNVFTNNIAIKDLQEYITKIDIEQIAKLAPAVNDYSAKEWLKFIEHHYKVGNVSFTEETLTLTKDLTTYLSENYVTKQQMQECIVAYPKTNRDIGELPKGWFSEISSINKEKISSKVRAIIESFVSGSMDEKDFSAELSNLLNKEVKVEFLGVGLYGMVYKISTEGCEDVVLKKFKQGYDWVQGHGSGIEVQTALFVNNHSNDFVKFYCGRVTGEDQNDGYLITQFLGENVTPIENTNVKGGYHIKCIDANKEMEHNVISGKIFDFGDVIVTKAE